MALVTDGSIRGTTHPYVGQEAVAVGACLALRPDDWVVSTHRGHGHLLAKGGDPNRLMAELFGKATGYGGGKGGTQHVADYAVGHPAEEIARRADETGVDLIAMGSHGHGALASLLLGSVTLGVLGRTKRPLLLLRGHGPAPGDSLKVGIAVDGSNYGIAAANYVRHSLM